MFRSVAFGMITAGRAAQKQKRPFLKRWTTDWGGATLATRWIGIGATVAILALAEAASAATLTLVQEAPFTLGPQSTSNPCIIAATTCQQPGGFLYTDFTQKGSVPAYDETSPTYTAGQLAGFGLTTFNIAIDVNTTVAEGETLQLFEVLVNAVQHDVYTGPSVPPIGVVSNNGNGFGDWTLRTVDLTGVDPLATVSFHAVWDSATDGGESFFLVSAPTQVPEPASLLLFGFGLVGMGAVRAAGGLRKHRS